MAFSTKARIGILLGLVLCSAVLYLLLSQLNAINGAHPVTLFVLIIGGLFILYALGFWFVRDARDNCALVFIILTGAILFRIILLPAGLSPDLSLPETINALRKDVSGESVVFEPFLLFDSDIWRYLWDGHVWTNGINPYRYAPSDPALDRLLDNNWSDIRDNVNHPQIRTIYPPFSLIIFRMAHLIAPGSIVVLKGLLVVLDLLAILFVGLALHALRRPLTELLLYAWNPLLIKVTAGSGHVDVAVAAALAATCYFLIRRKKAAAAISFAIAILCKIAPILLLPLVIVRIGWKYVFLITGILFIGYVPFLDAGTAIFDGLSTFAKEWEFNAGPFTLIRSFASLFAWEPSFMAKLICGLLLFAVIGGLALFDRAKEANFAASAAAGLGILLILSPVVMPWYITWVLPAAVIAGQRIWIYFSALLIFAFHIMVNGTESAVVLFFEYSILGILFLTKLRQYNLTNLFSTSLQNVFPPSLKGA